MMRSYFTYSYFSYRPTTQEKSWNLHFWLCAQSAFWEKKPVFCSNGT